MSRDSGKFHCFTARTYIEKGVGELIGKPNERESIGNMGKAARSHTVANKPQDGIRYINRTWSNPRDLVDLESARFQKIAVTLVVIAGADMPSFSSVSRISL